MPTAGGFSFANFLTDVLTVFLFVVWFWLLIIVFSDLFRRQDISGWGKALWVIVLILFPYLGVFGYMIFQSRGRRSAAASKLSRRAKNSEILLASVSRMRSRSLTSSRSQDRLPMRSLSVFAPSWFSDQSVSSGLRQTISAA